MATSILLDTNAWLMLLNSADANHQQANQVWRDLVVAKRPVVLTDWIVAETGNGLSRHRAKGQLKIAFERITRISRNELVVVQSDLLQRALEHYSRHRDKSWGLVDCASFLVMQDRGITEAFTSDRHFEQAGFTRLLAV